MSKRNIFAADEIVSQLCPTCGLCCNGVLFGDVALQSTDSVGRLKALGAVVEKKGRKQCLPQPCSCFDGALCRIYKARPERCRTFECGLLKGVANGHLELPAAARAIATARRQAERVRTLLRQLGQRDEHLPLNRRYARIMAEPIDLAGDETLIELRSHLMATVQALSDSVHRDFLS